MSHPVDSMGFRCVMIYNGKPVTSVDFSTVAKGDVLHVVQRAYGVNKWHTYNILGNGPRRIRIIGDGWDGYRSISHDSAPSSPARSR